MRALNVARRASLKSSNLNLPKLGTRRTFEAKASFDPLNSRSILDLPPCGRLWYILYTSVQRAC